MKKIFFILGILFCSTSFAQDCESYYLLQKDKTTEVTFYNKNGKEDGKQLYKISELSNNGGVVTATINVEVFDKKGKSVASSANEVKCTGGQMMMNMKMMLPQQQQEQVANSDFHFYIEYPSNMREGETLKDANMNMVTNTNNMKSEVTLDITDRKVVGKETITSPAGTWECYKITYNSRVKIKTMGIGIPVKMSGTEWYAPGFGIVKTDSKHGSSLITAMK